MIYFATTEELPQGATIDQALYTSEETAVSQGTKKANSLTRRGYPAQVVGLIVQQHTVEQKAHSENSRGEWGWELVPVTRDYIQVVMVVEDPNADQAETA